MKFLKSIGFLALAALVLASCSKSSNTTGPGTSAPTLAAPTFSGPDTSASTDTSYAATVAILAAGTFNVTAAGYLGLFTGLQATQSGNSWTWTHTFTTGGKATWTATSNSSGYNWTLVENGVTPSGTYSNWTSVSGYETSDGKSGHWVIYSSNSTAASDSIGWSTDASGNVSGTIVEYGSGNTVAQTLVFTNNKASHTGEITIYAGAVTPSLKVWDISWTASGGTWTEYDPTKGDAVVNSGHW